MYFFVELDFFLVNDPLNSTRTFKHQFTNKSIYDGEWQEAKMYGNGILTFENMNVYEGEFKYGEFAFLSIVINI